MWLSFQFTTVQFALSRVCLRNAKVRLFGGLLKVYEKEKKNLVRRRSVLGPPSFLLRISYISYSSNN